MNSKSINDQHTLPHSFTSSSPEDVTRKREDRAKTDAKFFRLLKQVEKCLLKCSKQTNEKRLSVCSHECPKLYQEYNVYFHNHIELQLQLHNNKKT